RNRWRRLQLEQTDHAKHALIDNVARTTLKMEPVTPARTIYLAQSRDAQSGWRTRRSCVSRSRPRTRRCPPRRTAPMPLR
ncbi:MAG: cell division protein FtsL, partial [Microbacterium sp.]|nr:cell division protein FtsL [Microbacterium sp.]